MLYLIGVGGCPTCVLSKRDFVRGDFVSFPFQFDREWNLEYEGMLNVARTELQYGIV